MASGSRDKWNRRFAGAPPPGSHDAAAVLRLNEHLLPTSGRALDLACGLGANALFLAERGLSVEAWDIAEVALDQLSAQAQSRGLDLHCRQADLDEQALPEAHFDVIVVSHFLDRDLCPDIASALAPGGLLFYQTFTADKLTTSGPSDPAFLLRKGELLSLFATLKLRYYREDARAGDLSRGERDRAQLVAQKSTAIPSL